jgi:hypothetical protein
MQQSGHCCEPAARVDFMPMTTDRATGKGSAALRRNAIWPWLVMPLVILALFAVLHNVRSSGAGADQDSSFGSGMP